MLGDAVLWILPLIASCHGVAVSNHPRVAADGAVFPDAEATGTAEGLRKPGYVRMPVSRHQFNGTGRSHKGWHWSSPPGTQGFPPPPLCVWSSTDTASTDQQTASVRPTPQPGSTEQSTTPWPSLPATSPTISLGPLSLVSASSLYTLATIARPGPTGSASTSEVAPYLAPREFQADRRWGWSSLDELGGIAYVMERKSPFPVTQTGAGHGRQF